MKENCVDEILSADPDVGVQEAAMPATAATATSKMASRFMATFFQIPQREKRTSRSPVAVSLYQLLASVDVVRDASDRCIDHEVDGERRNIGWTDHPPDWQRCSELFATRIQLVAEDRCR